MSGPPIGVGDRIAEKYTVESIIGEGGMGLVVAARHLELDQRVAIKLLLPSIAEQGTVAERFRREARSAARLRSEHVCRVLDVGTLPSGVPYLVMELLEGRDLATELEKRGPLPTAEALEYVLQACEGLAEAHSVGIVHRDLKPANLFLAKRSDGSRRIKLLDFGVSKALDDSGADQQKLTQTSALIGSPLYMSPEQLSSSRDVDVRTDIWALGAVLYELLSGKTPFTGGNIPQLVHAVMNETPPSVEAANTTVPRGIDAVITRALQKERDARYPSVAEFAADLAPFAPRHALVSVSRVSRLLSSQDRKSPVGAEDERASRGSNGQGTPMSWTGAKKASAGARWVGIGAAILLLLGFGFALALLYRARVPEVAVPEGQEKVPEGEELPIAKPAPQTKLAVAPAPAPVQSAVVVAEPALAAEPARTIEPQRVEAAPRHGADRPRTRSEVTAREAATDLSSSTPQGAPPSTAPAAKPTAKLNGITDFGGRR